MKKTYLSRLICIIVFIPLMLIGCNMDGLPKGEFIKSSKSPDNSYTVNAYVCSGNATTDFSVRCEVVDNENENVRNIYWQYKQEDVEIAWEDNETVVIDNHRLNVKEDSYDWRDE